MNIERDELTGWILNLSDRAFVHPIFEWSQFRGGYNWVTFHLVHLSFERDIHLTPGIEIEVIVLGLGLRFRRNDDWRKSASGRHLLSVMDEIRKEGHA